MAVLQHEAEHSEDSLSASVDLVREADYTDHPLQLSEMTQIAADIKNFLFCNN